MGLAAEFSDEDEATVGVIGGVLVIEVFLFALNLWALYPLRFLAVALHELGHCGVARGAGSDVDWRISGTKGGKTSFKGDTSR